MPPDIRMGLSLAPIGSYLAVTGIFLIPLLFSSSGFLLGCRF